MNDNLLFTPRSLSSHEPEPDASIAYCHRLKNEPIQKSRDIVKETLYRHVTHCQSETTRYIEKSSNEILFCALEHIVPLSAH